jgi:hypothetical protein
MNGGSVKIDTCGFAGRATLRGSSSLVALDGSHKNRGPDDLVGDRPSHSARPIWERIPRVPQRLGRQVALGEGNGEALSHECPDHLAGIESGYKEMGCPLVRWNEM